ncbi:hypothetical protein [Metallosphaera hakonensis]|nr:hypothetical protein [Metallosphaera hakonensis]
MKGNKGLSTVMGSLFLIVLVLVAWTFLFRYALFYVHVAQGNPDISLSSTVVQLNGGVYMIEVNVKNGDLPFTLSEIVVNGQPYTGSVYDNFPVLSNGNQATTLPMPLTLRPSQEVTLYYFTTTFTGSATHPIVSIVGKYGSSVIQIQSSAEVLYG